jgi:ABC-type phosphate transport system permease subunit
MIAFVAVHAWPVFAHNGLSWLWGGGDFENEIAKMNAVPNPTAAVYHLRAFPLIYGTLLTSVLAVGFGIVVSVLASLFIVELAPPSIRRITIPVVRLLASVPSVVYGLIGILVLVPFIGNHIIN